MEDGFHHGIKNVLIVTLSQFWLFTLSQFWVYIPQAFVQSEFWDIYR